MSYANGPKIVTNNLVACFDAASDKSFLSSGLYWQNLSNKSYFGTLVSTTNRTNDFKGCLSFDGISGYVSTNLPTSNGVDGQRQITVEAYMVLDSNPTGWYGITNQYFGNYYAIKSDTYKAIVMLTSTTNGNVANNIWPESNKAIPTGVPISLTLSVVEDNTATYYINGKKDVVYGPYGNLRFQGVGGQFLIGKGIPGQPFKGKIGLMRIYDRALSENEILQNFNATRGRFNL